MFRIRPPVSQQLVRGALRQKLRYPSVASRLHAAALSSNAKKKSTISAAITKDHRELEQYYNEVVNNPSDHDHQQRFGNQFTWELARHSVAEELIVYPAFERHMGQEGRELAEHDALFAKLSYVFRARR